MQLVLIVVLAMIFSIIGVNNVQAKTYTQYTQTGISEFPEDYQTYLKKLSDLHPNWTFTLFYTKLDWEDVISNEGHSDFRKNPLNLIPESSNYPEDWRCEKDKDKRFDNGTWMCASDKAIKYIMDPRNILNEDNIFQFAELKYTEGAQTEEGIKSLTDGTFLEGDEIAKALIQAGKNANLDAYFITARLIQEQLSLIHI